MEHALATSRHRKPQEGFMFSAWRFNDAATAKYALGGHFEILISNAAPDRQARPDRDQLTRGS